MRTKRRTKPDAATVDPKTIPQRTLLPFDDDDIKSEKWAYRTPFEDPDGQPDLPSDMQAGVADWKRLNECFSDGLLPPVVYASESSGGKDRAGGGKRGSKRGDPAAMTGDPAALGATGVLGDAQARPAWAPDGVLATCLAQQESPFRSIQIVLSQMLAVHRCRQRVFPASESNATRRQQLFDLIYPKTKDGRAAYNPSGKYIVKLFLAGAWRKVVIDDRFPVNAEGQMLLPVGANAMELWVAILCKAVLKVINGHDKSLVSEPVIISMLSGYSPDAVCPIRGDDALATLSAELARKALVVATVADEPPASPVDDQPTSEEQQTQGSAEPEAALTEGDSAPPSALPTPARAAPGCDSAPPSAPATPARAPPAVDTISFAFRPGHTYSICATKTDDIGLPLVRLQSGFARSYEPTSLFSGDLADSVPRLRTDSRGASTPTRKDRKSREGKKDRDSKVGTPDPASTPTPMMDLPADPPEDPEAETDHESDTNNFSFQWIPLQDFLEHFPVVSTYSPPGFYESTQTVSDHWEDFSQPFRPKQPSLLTYDSPEDVHVSMILTPMVERPQGDLHRSTLFLEEYHWSDVSVRRIVSEVSAYRVNAQSVTLPAGRHTYQISTEAPRGCSYQISARNAQLRIDNASTILAEAMGLSVTTIEEEYPVHQPGAWTPWFRYVLTVREQALVACQLIVSDEDMTPYARMVLVNNDTGASVLDNALLRCSVQLEPNQHGYTLLCDAKVQAALPAGSAQVRITTTSDGLVDVEPSPLRHVVDHDGVLGKVNKYSEVFRFVLKVKEKVQVSAHLAAVGGRFPSQPLELTLFDRNVPVVAETGKGAASLSTFFLHPNERSNEQSHSYVLVAKYDASAVVPSPLSPQASASGINASTPRTAVSTAVGDHGTPAVASAVALQDTSGLGLSASLAHMAENAARTSNHLLEWRLRLACSAHVDVKKDTEREDRHSAIRASWSTKDGRLNKARQSREKFLKADASGEAAAEPFTITGDPETVKLLTADEIAQRKQQIRDRMDAFAQRRAEIEQRRAHAKQMRADQISGLQEEFVQTREQWKESCNQVFSQRDQYRTELLEAEAARIAAEQAELEAASSTGQKSGRA